MISCSRGITGASRGRGLAPSYGCGSHGAMRVCACSGGRFDSSPGTCEPPEQAPQRLGRLPEILLSPYVAGENWALAEETKRPVMARLKPIVCEAFRRHTKRGCIYKAGSAQASQRPHEGGSRHPRGAVLRRDDGPGGQSDQRCHRPRPTPRRPPTCHAGGRGFESRRSRYEAPASNLFRSF